MEKKKRDLLLIVLIGACLLKLFDTITHFEMSFHFVVFLVYTLIVILAIYYSVKERKYLAGVSIVLLKILIPITETFLEGIYSGNLGALVIIKGILGLVLFCYSFYFVYYLFKTKEYKFVPPLLNQIIWPFLVFVYYAIFEAYGEGYLVASGELIALILFAHLSEKLLWLAAFIIIPFDLIDDIISNTQFAVSNYFKYALGLVMLILAAKGTIASFLHFKKDKRETEAIHE